MKCPVSAALVALVVLAAAPAASGARALRKAGDSSGQQAGAGLAAANDRTISKVVKLLQQMLDASKKEGEQDRDLFAKHKCYCDDNTAAKTTSIKTLTKQIGLLENDIQQLQGSNALLSSEVAQLQADMDANTKAQADATALRSSAETAFQQEESDLTAAIGQLASAVDVLAAIGSDQSLQAAADHSQFMANYSGSLLNLRSSVREALVAANTFLTPAEQAKAAALLQAPFTGAYASQSGEIVGILKQMKATFESNLASAKASEEAAKKAHTAFLDTKKKEFDTMKASFDDKQQSLGSNDGTLVDKKSSLSQAQQQKSSDEDFLASLTPTCEQKAKEFDERNMLRTSEEAAITEAISILDNDMAFKAFGKVAATSTGATSFVQLADVARHQHGGQAAEAAKRLAVTRVLTREARAQKSSKLARVAVLLSAGNPFTKVLEAIASMKQLLTEEERVDQEQFDWCDSERTSNNDNLKSKESQITQLNGQISTLETDINDPQRGLKAMIQQTELSLGSNSDSQAAETATRREENVVYQQAVGDAAGAAALLAKAITALEKYYAKDAANATFLTQADPAPPSTWTEYTGQSSEGSKVINMLKFIRSETQKEEESLHSSENTAQTSYEDSMAQLKAMEADLQTNLVTFQSDLATSEKSLADKRDELDKTTREKISIERYLALIKPGCDFITDNLQLRKDSRLKETSALDQAVTLLKATPAYVAATAAAKLAAQGPCSPACAASEAHVDCKACLAGVSVPGYCAGHAGTPGC